MDNQTLIPNDQLQSRDAKLIKRGSIFFFVIGFISVIILLYRLISNSFLIYSVTSPLLSFIAAYLGRTVQKNSIWFLVIIIVILIPLVMNLTIILTDFTIILLYCSDYSCTSTEIIFIFWKVISILLHSIIGIACIILIKATSRYRKQAHLVY